MYLAEHRGGRLASVVRFLSDVLNGLPSIVVGIFAWQFLVRPVKHFSALAGGIALAVMMIPLVARATEEMIRLVPNSLREAALALGYPRWRTSLTVVLRTALPGIVTGALVAVARIAGETAPCSSRRSATSSGPRRSRSRSARSPCRSSRMPSVRTRSGTAGLGRRARPPRLVLVISLIARFVTRSRFGHGHD